MLRGNPLNQSIERHFWNNIYVFAVPHIQPGWLVGWLISFTLTPRKKGDIQATTTIYLNVRTCIVHPFLNELRASSGPVVA
jgi:hypothetical protein